MICCEYILFDMILYKNDDKSVLVMRLNTMTELTIVDCQPP